MLKPEIRILGIDDGPFSRKDKSVLVVGVICRGNECLDGLLSTKVAVDGLDATEKLIKRINSSRHKPQLKVIMLDGITLGGFNLVDIKKLWKKTGIPVIVINRKKPDIKAVEEALKKHFKDWEERMKIVEHAGKIRSMKVNDFKIYYQAVGLPEDEVKEIILLSLKRAQIPEPLRAAHIIATGIVRGESEGHA